MNCSDSINFKLLCISELREWLLLKAWSILISQKIPKVLQLLLVLLKTGSIVQEYSSIVVQ